MRTQIALCLLVGLVSTVQSLVPPFESYDNDFVNPDYIVSKKFNATTAEAQSSIIQWADGLAVYSPWSVMNKTIPPPSGDKHDYMSWAPYQWPNCSSVHNTTQLTPLQTWTTCPYVTIDGDINPANRALVDDIGAFSNFSDAVLYSSIAWILTGSSNYSANTAAYINTWFLDPATAMNPNLQYSQMNGGPDGQNGTHTGILDLKCMAKVATAIMILRKANSPHWTSNLDRQMVNWTFTYINWLETASLALQEAVFPNNHGTYYYNQLASLKLLVNDMAGAQNVTKTYFNKQYLSQINSTGDQPLEAARTRPYHYRCYNLAAMITNARLANYSGFSAWDLKTTAGADIQTALDFAMTVPAGSEEADELYPNIAAVAAEYGDPTGKYAAFLNAHNNGTSYIAQPYFLWNQPLSDSGLSTSTGSSGKKNAGSVTRPGGGKYIWGIGASVVASTLIL